MANFSFKISSKKREDGRCQIVARVDVTRTNRPRIKTGVYIFPDLFDEKKGEIIIPKRGKFNGAQVAAATQAQNDLDTFRNKIASAIAAGQESGATITGDWLEKVLQMEKDGSLKVRDRKGNTINAKAIEAAETEATEKKAEEERRIAHAKPFADWVDAYCNDQRISETTRKHYGVLVRKVARFEDFQRLTSRPSFVFNVLDVTTEDIQAFRDFMRKEGDLSEKFPQVFDIINKNHAPLYKCRKTVKVCNMSENGLSVPFKKLRAVFNWLKASKIIPSDPFDGVTIEAGIYSDPVYLTIEERNQIADFDLSKESIILQQQRDIFIFQCLTGPRVSDLTHLTEDNLTKVGKQTILNYVPIKTRNKQHQEHPRIPLSPRAVALIKKYKGVDKQGRLFPFISDQNYCENIKKLMEVCKIERKVIVRDPHTGESVTKELKEIAASHLARKTFAANIYHNVKDPSIVCKMTGHVEGSRAFARYRTIDDDILGEAIKSIE